MNADIIAVKISLKMVCEDTIWNGYYLKLT